MDGREYAAEAIGHRGSGSPRRRQGARLLQELEEPAGNYCAGHPFCARGFAARDRLGDPEFCEIASSPECESIIDYFTKGNLKYVEDTANGYRCRRGRVPASGRTIYAYRSAARTDARGSDLPRRTSAARDAGNALRALNLG
jgi:hypothetical protein